jgi:hypothetical protein
MELFQSLWSITFHGGSASRLVRARFSLLFFVADMWEAFWHLLSRGTRTERHILLDASSGFLEAAQAEVRLTSFLPLG